MSTLVVDIGNARVKWSFAHGGELVGTAGSALHAGREADAFAEMEAALGGREISAVVVANVAGDAPARQLDALVERRFGLRARYLQTTAEAAGVRCAYAQPTRLGVDRWVAVIAAHHRARPHGRAACVITAGTALTFDAVSADGRHLGGLIFPGPRIMAEALASHTHRIGPTLQIEQVPRGLDVLGRSTDEAVGHAAWLGPAAAFDRVIATVAAQTPSPPLVLLAGGDAATLRRWLETDVEVEADLVLAGLALMADPASVAIPPSGS